MSLDASPAPTAREIARRLGVSPGTVSRCLNGHPNVDPATRGRVLECALEIGYRHDLRRRGRKPLRRELPLRSIGLLIGWTCGLEVGEIDTGYIGHFVVEAVARAGSAAGVNLSVAYVEAQTNPTALLDPANRPPLLDGDIEGIILLYPFDNRFVDSLASRMPVVSLEQPYPGVAGVDVIAPNQSGAAMRATTRLIEAGHRRISFVCSGSPRGFRHAVTCRMAGYMCGMTAAGLRYDPDDLIGGFAPLPVAQIVQQVLHRIESGTTGIVFSVERDAYLVWQHLQGRGINVPEDVSIISVGGVAPMYGLPQLATMQLPFHTMARAAVRRLASRKQKPDQPKMSLEFDCSLVDGATIDKPRR